jgi:fido (protein-threonine AMPylation protein)
MISSPPLWQAHNSADYNSKMTTQCSALQAEIVASPTRRKAVLSDPRNLHRELFADFAPSDHSEYAGSYRGTPRTSLDDRRVWSGSQLKSGERYEFCLPAEVPDRMAQMLKNSRDILKSKRANDFQNLLALTYTFCWFGKIHPFLDGNGHVQRAIFAAMATESGYPLSARFTIHPRPYDRLLATALEIFTCAPRGKEDREIGLVAEYLAFFLDGPFNAPRRHVGAATPYK